MRWHLLKTYDKNYAVDLHGNSKKKETAPDGSADVNVFDIMQGVSINIFVKTGKKKANELGKVFHFDLYGKREMKYDFLSDSSLKSVYFQELKPEKPFLFFVPKNNKGSKEYEKGFRVDELFSVNVTGVVTARDSFVIDFEKPILKKRMEEFSDTNFTDDSIRRKFFGNKKEGKYLAGDSRGWKMVEARKTIQNFNHNDIIQKIAYRLFDDRYIYYHSSMVDWGREKFMYHFINKDNVGIDLCRQLVTDDYSHIFITNKIVDDSFVSNKSRERGYVFPLYLYPENKGQQTIGQSSTRIPNLNSEIVEQLKEKLGLTFTTEKETTKNTFAPIDILDYIYAVLHSPTYREKYKEFLKIDFPRVPFPKDKVIFWQLAKFGAEIRQIHLLESPTVEKYITQYPEDGNNVVVKTKYENGKVYINDTQYFDNVPQIAWDFYIGGYQPAQKWLKDRKERTLEFDDILHYQKIIVALTETDRLMNEINKIVIE
jgi:predicted helicase